MAIEKILQIDTEDGVTTHGDVKKQINDNAGRENANFAALDTAVVKAQADATSALTNAGNALEMANSAVQTNVLQGNAITGLRSDVNGTLEIANSAANDADEALAAANAAKNTANGLADDIAEMGFGATSVINPDGSEAQRRSLRIGNVTASFDILTATNTEGLGGSTGLMSGADKEALDKLKAGQKYAEGAPGDAVYSTRAAGKNDKATALTAVVSVYNTGIVQTGDTLSFRVGQWGTSKEEYHSNGLYFTNEVPKATQSCAGLMSKENVKTLASVEADTEVLKRRVDQLYKPDADVVRILAIVSKSEIEGQIKTGTNYAPPRGLVYVHGLGMVYCLCYGGDGTATKENREFYLNWSNAMAPDKVPAPLDVYNSLTTYALRTDKRFVVNGWNRAGNTLDEGFASDVIGPDVAYRSNGAAFGAGGGLVRIEPLTYVFHISLSTTPENFAENFAGLMTGLVRRCDRAAGMQVALVMSTKDVRLLTYRLGTTGASDADFGNIDFWRWVDLRGADGGGMASELEERLSVVEEEAARVGDEVKAGGE